MRGGEYYDYDYDEHTLYGEVFHSAILKLFGDELTFNQSKYYTRDENATSDLRIEARRRIVGVGRWTSMAYEIEIIINNKFIRAIELYADCEMDNYFNNILLQTSIGQISYYLSKLEAK